MIILDAMSCTCTMAINKTLLSTEEHLHVELSRHFKKKKATLEHLAYQHALNAPACSALPN